MYLVNVIVQSSQVNFLNLSLLICQLFAGCSFRTAHILYHPEAFDDRFTSEIRSSCSLEVPTTTNDITSTQTVPNQVGKTDHILQLIFLQRHQLAEHTDRLKESHAFYRIFIFCVNQSESDDNQLIQEMKVLSFENSYSLLAIYNPLDGSTRFYAMLKGEKSINRIHLPNDQSVLNKQIFDSLFGESVFGYSLGVSYTQRIYNILQNGSVLDVPWISPFPFANIFSSKMNLNFTDMTTVALNASGAHLEHQMIHHTPKAIYNELSADHEPITATKGGESTNENNIALHFDDTELPYITTNVERLYPYQQSKIRIILVYGDDFARPKHHTLLNPSFFLNMTNLWTVITLLVSASILCWLRRRNRLRHDGFISAFMEVFAVAFGGGAVHYRHRLEKMFFAIALLASFFFVSILLADFSLHSIAPNESDRIETLEQITKQNKKVYLHSSLMKYRERFSKELSEKLKTSIEIEELTVKRGFNNKNSYLVICLENVLDGILKTTSSWKRDFDVLRTDFGGSINGFYLVSDGIIPQKTVDKFNTMSSSITENGLNKFYESYSQFLDRLRNGPQTDGHDDSDFRPITVHEFYYVMIVYFIGLVTAAVVLIAQAVWRHLQQQKENRRQNEIVRQRGRRAIVPID